MTARVSPSTSASIAGGPRSAVHGAPRSPVVQGAVLVGMALLVGALVFNGGNSSSAEAYVVSSAAHAAHIRQLSHDRHRGNHYTEQVDKAPHGSEHQLLDRLWSKLSPQRGRRKGPLRWMAIGDSITQGLAASEFRRRPVRNTHPANGTCGYLSTLSTVLNTTSAAELSAPLVQFVGQFEEAHLGPYPASCARVRHCATWGIAAAAVAANDHYKAAFRPLHLAVDGAPRESLTRGARVYDWVRQHRPDVVSVLIGTNDLARGTGNGALVDDLLRPIILQSLRAAEDAAALDRRSHSDARRWELRGKCDAVVVVILLLPRADSVNDDVVSANEKLERRDRQWLHDRCVEIISAADGLDPHDTSHFYDGLHPGPAGENIVARNILRELTLWHPGSSSPVPLDSNATLHMAPVEDGGAAPVDAAAPMATDVASS